MVFYRDVKITRILNPTSIDLGEYVINPYKGCAYGCLYCYVRSNRTQARESRPWGTYVDIRANALDRLSKELDARRPRSVLLGSTTECFQPVEETIGLTLSILKMLNSRGVRYTILTRSPLILKAKDVLKEGFCDRVYFTFNAMSQVFKSALESLSPDFSQRLRAMDILLKEGIPVVPYLSPILPWVTDLSGALAEAPGAEVEAEGLNFRLANIQEIIAAISHVNASVGERYQKMLTDPRFYEIVWQDARRVMNRESARQNKKSTIYLHAFGQFFSQSYQSR